MDKYDATNDHYCYPHSTVLKNRLDIRDLETLEAAERDITAITVDLVPYRAPPYSLDSLKAIHAALFSELYQWAGSIRTVDIAKGGTRFCHSQFIERYSERIFNDLEGENWLKGLPLDAFCERLAEHYCEINMIHPFREGNGRVQRILFEHLALSAGYELDWGTINQREWIQANIDGVQVNYAAMTGIFKRIVTPAT